MKLEFTDSSQFTELLNSIGQPSSPTEANTTTATTVVSNNPVKQIVLNGGGQLQAEVAEEDINMEEKII